MIAFRLVLFCILSFLEKQMCLPEDEPRKISELAAILSKTRSHRFSRGEYQPQLNEDHAAASGPISKTDIVESLQPFRNSKYKPLVYFSDQSVVFSKIQHRWMTRKMMYALSRLAQAIYNRQPDGRLELHVVGGWFPSRKELRYSNLTIESNITSSKRVKRWIDLTQFTRQSSSAAVIALAVEQKFLQASNQEILLARNRATMFEDEMHQAGRGIDLLIVDTKNPLSHSKKFAGALAELAYYIVDFDWCTVRPDYVVHCSVRPDKISTGVQIFRHGCFPGNVMVTRADGELIQMQRLKLGDLIKTIDTSNGGIMIKNTRVIGFLHRNTVQITDIIKIDFECQTNVSRFSCQSLLVTPNHLIARYSCELSSFSTKIRMVFASDLKLFDRIPGEKTIHIVRRLSWLKKSHENAGSYAPLTLDGTFLANGVLVSCYAHFRHPDLAHLIMKPINLLLYYFNCWIFHFEIGLWQKSIMHILVKYLVPILPQDSFYTYT